MVSFVTSLGEQCTNDLLLCHSSTNYPLLFWIFTTHLPYFFVLYFFGYKTVFSFLNNPKNLDPSCKMDLDLSDCIGRVKLVPQ